MDANGQCPSGSERAAVGRRIRVALLRRRCVERERSLSSRRRRCDERTVVAIGAAPQQPKQARACVRARARLGHVSTQSTQCQ